MKTTETIEKFTPVQLSEISYRDQNLFCFQHFLLASLFSPRGCHLVFIIQKLSIQKALDTGKN